MRPGGEGRVSTIIKAKNAVGDFLEAANQADSPKDAADLTLAAKNCASVVLTLVQVGKTERTPPGRGK